MLLIYACLAAAAAAGGLDDGYVATDAIPSHVAAALASQIAPETSGMMPLNDDISPIFVGEEGVFGVVKAKHVRGPVHAHSDASQVIAEMVVLYVEVSGPPSDFVLFDKLTQEDVATIPIEAGRAIRWDNVRYTHRVDAAPTSERRLLGPSPAGLHGGARRRAEATSYGGYAFDGPPQYESRFEPWFQGACSPCRTDDSGGRFGMGTCAETFDPDTAVCVPCGTPAPAGDVIIEQSFEQYAFTTPNATWCYSATSQSTRKLKFGYMVATSVPTASEGMLVVTGTVRLVGITVPEAAVRTDVFRFAIARLAVVGSPQVFVAFVEAAAGGRRRLQDNDCDETLVTDEDYKIVCETVENCDAIEGRMDALTTEEMRAEIDAVAAGLGIDLPCVQVDAVGDATVDTVPEASLTAMPTAAETAAPSAGPSTAPVTPTISPLVPTVTPVRNPTTSPTVGPTADPTAKPTADPTAKPTADPTAKLTADPTAKPTADPTAKPTAQPTADPTASPAPTSPPPNGCCYAYASFSDNDPSITRRPSYSTPPTSAPITPTNRASPGVYVT